MNTYQLGFATAICLFASSGNAQTAIATAPKPVGKASTSLAPDTGSSVPGPAAYLWKTAFVDDQPKAPLAGIAVDATENVYGTKGCAIVKITPDGKMITIAGRAESAGSADGIGSAARFNSPAALAFDKAGNLYVSDRNNHTIRKIDAAGAVTTLAGSAGLQGNTDGACSDARFYHPSGIGLDTIGNLFIADVCNHTIRRITPTGIVSTVALPTTPGQSKLNNSDAFAVDSGGDAFYAPRADHVIRKVAPDGTITIIGGAEAQSPAMEGGPRSLARFQKLTGLAIDAQGYIYIIDVGAIRKMSPDGTVQTITGEPGAPNRVAEGPGSGMRLDRPVALAVSPTGVVYVACGNGIIQGTPVR